MKTKVSVIVPIYNVEKLLKKAVDSLVNQTLSDIEIILVDDGSPDNCGKIIDEYANKHSNIIAVHKENGGLSNARNAGMAKATGEYIGFLDPDDFAEPEMFEKMYYSAKENDSDLVFCGYKEVFSPSYIENREIKISRLTGDTFDLAYANVFDGLGAYAWNKIYKSSIIKSNGLLFPDGVTIVEDTVFLFNFLKYAKSFSVVNEFLYNYIRHPQSICATYKPGRFEYYQLGADTTEAVLRCFKNEFVQDTVEQNRKNELFLLLGTLDMQSSLKNRASAKKRYKELCELISDRHFLDLVIRYSSDITDKHNLRQIKLIKAGRRNALFLNEFFKMRIVARIKYYLNIGG